MLRKLPAQTSGQGTRTLRICDQITNCFYQQAAPHICWLSVVEKILNCIIIVHSIHSSGSQDSILPNAYYTVRIHTGYKLEGLR
jgi:hypothetical protein